MEYAKKILLVDDEEGIQMLYKEELEDEGYTVFSAYTGEEALGKVEEIDPDLVVVDIYLGGGMNGIEVLRRINLEIDDTLPIIISSAFREYKQDLGAWAADDYIVKSASLGELMLSIRKHIR